MQGDTDFKDKVKTFNTDLFHSELFSQLDVKDPLIQLANTINWTVFDDTFEQHYSQDKKEPVSLT
jgi:hypothetical protein